MTVLGYPLAQLLARLLMTAGPLAGLVAAAAAGVPPPGWVVALAVAAGVGWAAMPESLFGTLSLAVVVGWWGVADVDGLPAEVLVAALGMLAAHIAAVVVAYGPPEMDVDPATVRLWLTRAALLFTAAPLVWVVATVVRDRPEPPGVWIAAMAAITVAGLVAAVAFLPPGRSAGEA